MCPARTFQRRKIQLDGGSRAVRGTREIQSVQVSQHLNELARYESTEDDASHSASPSPPVTAHRPRSLTACFCSPRHAYVSTPLFVFPGACPVGYAGDGKDCALCPLTATVASTSFSGGAFPRSALARVFGSAPLPSTKGGFACNTAGGLSFSWFGMADGAQVNFSTRANQATTPTLVLPALSFRSGAQVVVQMRACYANTTDTVRRSCATATAAFVVTPTPLVARLLGANVMAGTRAVTLDCERGSSDPDDEPENLRFDWTCVGPDPRGCFTSDLQPLRLAPNSSTQTLQLQRNGEGLRYNITCTVSKGARSASASGYVIARNVVVPAVSVEPLTDKANPAARIVLSGNVASASPGSLRVFWEQAFGPTLVDLSNTNTTRFSPDGTQMVLQPNALQPAGLYGFRLVATDAGGRGFAEALVEAASVPRGVNGSAVGSISAFVSGAGNTSGTAYVTSFQLLTSRWLDVDGPLLFQFSYSVPGSTEPSVVLTRFRPARMVDALLPPGLASQQNRIILEVVAMNAFGGMSAPVRKEMQLSLPPMASGDAQAAFLGSILDGALRCQVNACAAANPPQLLLSAAAPDALFLARRIRHGGGARGWRPRQGYAACHRGGEPSERLLVGRQQRG